MGGGADGFIEIERKFDVDAGFTVPDLAVLPMVASVTSPETFGLVATYYDTPDLRLATARITLRRRTGGPDAGWHLKLPAGSERREVHEPLGGPGAGGCEPAPARLAALAEGATRGEPLAAIARLATTRTVRHLVDGSGQVLAEVADDRVTGARPAGAISAVARPPAIPATEAEDGRGAPDGRGAQDAERWRQVAAWREVEVELRAGPPELLAAAAELLLRSGARRAGHGSKLARLLASG